MDGKAIITIEGVGSTKTNLHPIQEKMADLFGSQCGFCTPGFIMSFYSLIRNNPFPTEEEIEHCIDGNLCRCTGYRPILDAGKFFTKNENKDLKICSGSGLPCNCSEKNEEEDKVEYNEIKHISQHAIFPVELRKRELTELELEYDGTFWFRPNSLKSLLKIKKNLKIAK